MFRFADGTVSKDEKIRGRVGVLLLTTGPKAFSKQFFK
jgi:hypothetical protein